MTTFFSRLRPAISLTLALLCAPLSGLAQTNVGVNGNTAVLREGESLLNLDLDAAGGSLDIDLATKLTYPAASDDYAKITTPFGDIYLQFFTAKTPLTVANFKSYLATDSSTDSQKLKTYDGTFIHRSIPGFVIQGGGYRPVQGLPEIEKKAPVLNEFYFANTRGTVAMAKVGPATGAEPNETTINSATNQWFISLADNRANLDNQNGGFTVFARVLGDGMNVVDRIAALNRTDIGAPFDSLPYYNVTSGQTSLNFNNLFPLTTVRAVAASSVPAALKAAPAFTYTLVANNRPSAVKASIKNGRLQLSSGPKGGTANITLRATTPHGISNEFLVTANAIGQPRIVKQLPAITNAPLGFTTTLTADFTAWPLNLRWQSRPNPTAAWTDIVANDTYGDVDTEKLTIALPADTAEEAATRRTLQGTQFRYIVSNTIEGVTRSVESTPTTLNITTTLAFATPLAATTTAALGATVTLGGAASTTTKPAPTYQWQRLAPGSTTWQNLANTSESAPTLYSGVTTASFKIDLSGTGVSALAARDLDRSQFRCVLTHNAGSGTVTTEGRPTVLRVTTLPLGFSAQPATLVTGTLGGTATVSVTSLSAAANTPVLYKWQRRAAGTTAFVDIADSTTEAPTRFTGSTTRTLTIALPSTDGTASAASLALTDDQYQCVVSNVLGSATSRPATLRVLAADFNYVTQENQTLPGLDAQEGRVFSITGLPKGLTFNAGTITGTPTAKPGIYKVVVTIRDAGVVTGTRTYFLSVKALSGNNAGGYEAFLSSADAPPYAKLAVLITSTGTYTGTLTTAEDGRTFALKGSVVRSAATGAISLAAPLSLARSDAPAGRLLELNFTITSAGVFTTELGARASAGATLVAKAAATTAAPGVRLASYSAGNIAPASGSSATYTLAFTLPEALDDDDDRPVPQGSGYATAKIAANGTLSLTGKLADGTRLTASLATDTAADYRLFALPYGATPGAWLIAELPLTGAQALRPSNSEPYTRFSIVTADRKEVYWQKPANAASSSYATGFGPLGLTVRMEPWNPNNYNQLGFAISSDPTKGLTNLLLSGDNLNNSAPNAGGLPTSVAITYTTGVMTKATSPDANAFSAKLTTFTGLFTGKLNLNTPAPKRTVKFEGVFLMGTTTPSTGAITAEGFTLVPAAAGATPATATSGRIQFAQPAE